jgi:cytochrome P450
MRALGEVFAAPWGGHVVTPYELCDSVLRDRRNFLELGAGWRRRQGEATRWTAPSSRAMAKVLVNLNGEEHTRVRRVVGAMFDRQTLDTLLTPVRRITDRLLDRLGERLAAGEADLHELVSEPLPMATIGHWLELPPTDYSLMNDLAHKMAYTQELVPSASRLAESDEAIAMLRAYFLNIIAERRRRPGEDPISRWIAAWDRIEPNPELADEHVYDLSFFVLISALETTGALLSQVVLHLLEHPAQWDWLTHHPQDVPGAVEESLRYDPAIHLVTRYARVDTEVAGVPVRADETVHLVLAAANRDPARYEDPDSFNIHRPPAPHLAFSAGAHYCMGAPLARCEAQALLRGLLERFPRLTLARTPQWSPRVVFRRPLSLPVALS